ncbi:MAG: hypothetical protein IT170_11340, partial [Bryobacterales bacterium]|nr:hypothetical protein [Bryobacterales bacterium]
AEAVCLQKLTDWNNDPVAFEGEDPISAGESLGHAATTHVEYDDKDRRRIEPDTHYPTFEKIHRYRTHWERKHARALAAFDRAQRARHAEANQQRAEAEAQRQAEAHALKQELALAREARQQELHALRMAGATAKQSSTSANPNPATSPATNPGAESASDEAAALAYLESLLNTPAPMTEQDFLRMRATQSANGFVSQNPPSRNGDVRN